MIERVIESVKQAKFCFLNAGGIPPGPELKEDFGETSALENHFDVNLQSAQSLVELGNFAGCRGSYLTVQFHRSGKVRLLEFVSDAWLKTRITLAT